MVSEIFAVKINVGRGVCASDFKVVTLGFGKVGFNKLLGVKAGASVVIVSAVLTVDSIPGVRQIDSLPALADFRGNCGSVS